MQSRFRIQDLSPNRIISAYLRRLKFIHHIYAWKKAQSKSKNPAMALSDMRDRHANERCFIIGNGPSLREMDVGILSNEFTFGLNRIYLMFDKLGFETSYYVAMNELVIQQSVESIRQVDAPKFLNWSTRGLFPKWNNVNFLLEKFKPHFSKDLRMGVWGGATVTFVAMQIAFYLGFNEVILIGVDHRFHTRGTPHKVVEGKGVDQNHFDPQYFPLGTKWQLPDLRTSEYAYRLAKEAFEGDNRRILDATLDGDLSVFPKVEFNEVLMKKM